MTPFSLGFHAELDSMEMSSINQTFLLVDPKLTRRKKASYSYIGPVLIGVGGTVHAARVRVS